MTNIEGNVARYTVATIWLVTAALSFGLYPIEDSMLLVAGLGVSADLSRLVVYAGAALDLAMGLATLIFPRRLLWLAQMMVIASYTALATVLVPEYWLHPFGPLLKNLAIFALLWLLYRHEPGGGGR